MWKLWRLVRACVATIAIVLVIASASAQQPRGQTTHSLKPTPQTIAWGYYDASTPPALRVQSGDTVEIQTVSGRPAQLEAAGLPPARSSNLFGTLFNK